MNDRFTIGKLAKTSGIAPSAIRYYERAGLIVPLARTEGNYRVYCDESLRRLKFIQAAKIAGFTLEDICKLILIREESCSPCNEVQKLVADRRDELERKLAQLQSAKEILDDYMGQCVDSSSKKCCVVLECLETAEVSTSACN